MNEVVFREIDQTYFEGPSKTVNNVVGNRYPQDGIIAWVTGDVKAGKLSQGEIKSLKDEPINHYSFPSIDLINPYHIDIIVSIDNPRNALLKEVSRVKEPVVKQDVASEIQVLPAMQETVLVETVEPTEVKEETPTVEVIEPIQEEKVELLEPVAFEEEFIDGIEKGEWAGIKKWIIQNRPDAHWRDLTIQDQKKLVNLVYGSRDNLEQMDTLIDQFLEAVKAEKNSFHR